MISQRKNLGKYAFVVALAVLFALWQTSYWSLNQLKKNVESEFYTDEIIENLSYLLSSLKDMEEDFQVSYKFENQPIEKVLIHSKILESALPEIRRTLNEEGVKYTLNIHPYSKSTSKIKGNIWFLMPSYSMIPSTISLGTELGLKTQRISHYSNEKFRFGTLVHIKFESKYAVSAKKSRKFNKDMKDWVNSLGSNVKIVRYVRDKFREQPPYMGTDDPYFDAQVGNWA